MPLTLRRRQRLPPSEPPFATPSAANPAVDLSPPTATTSVASANDTNANPNDTRTLRRRDPRRPAPRPAPRHTDIAWRDRMLGEVFFFLVGVGVWLSNALFTILGVTTPFGLTPLSALLGFGFHVLLSRAELYLWYRWREPWYLIGLIGCVVIDTSTTLLGLLPLAARWFPWLVGTTPVTMGDWEPLLRALIAPSTMPAWWPNALILIGLSLAFALGSERLLRTFARGMIETWQERPQS